MRDGIILLGVDSGLMLQEIHQLMRSLQFIIWEKNHHNLYQMTLRHHVGNQKLDQGIFQHQKNNYYAIKQQ